MTPNFTLDGDPMELVDLVYETPDGYVEVQSATPVGKSRWNTRFERVIQKKFESVYYLITWSRGSTEYQDEGPEYIEVVPAQAVPSVRFIQL